MGEKRGVYMGLVWKAEGKNHLDDLHVDGRIILKGVFKKQFGDLGLM
jgi:hypothetical protein